MAGRPKAARPKAVRARKGVFTGKGPSSPKDPPAGERVQNKKIYKKSDTKQSAQNSKEIKKHETLKNP